jgi:hypothetical protein
MDSDKPPDECNLEVLKRKCTSLFTQDDREVIKEAVHSVHFTLSDASYLLKAYYLYWFESTYGLSLDNSVDDTKALVVDKQLLETCCHVIKGHIQVQTREVKKPSTKVLKLEEIKRVLQSCKDEKEREKLQSELKKLEKDISKQDENKERKNPLFDSVYQFYKQHIVQDPLQPTVLPKRFNPPPKKSNPVQEPSKKDDTYSKLSLSHILNYSIDQTLTNYQTNIWSHFPKYVKRYLRCWLFQKHHVGNPEPNSEDRSLEKVLVKIAGQIAFTLLYAQDERNQLSFTKEDWLPWVTEGDLNTFQSCLVPSLLHPRKGEQHPNRLYDMKTRPSVYLQRMVWINRYLESMSSSTLRPKVRKLYSPLSLISTMVPGFIRLDTSGLTQLLMTQERIQDFKVSYKEPLNMTNKSNMLKTTAWNLGRSVTPKEEADFATSLWTFICKFDNHQDVLKTKRKNGTTWVFDNAVLTDGVSVNFQIIKEEDAKRKKRFVAKDTPKQPITETKRKKPASQKKHVETSLPSQTFPYETARILGGDPGKKDILALTDGFRTLRYTRGQRDSDTCKKLRTITSLALRKEYTVVQGTETMTVHDYECKYLSETSRKSCRLTSFVDHWKRKRLLMNQQTVYSHPFFRQMKFFVYSKTKSSEQKFFNKVKQTFCKGIETPNIPSWMSKSKEPIIQESVATLKTDKNHLLVGYGNWGKNPNLKNNAPTPGIGFRRRMNQVLGIETISQCEHFTSQTCPCCQTRSMENPKLPCKTRPDTQYSRHHLLRCKNVDCPSRWWNRNVVGSLNILFKFLTRVHEQKSKSTTGDESPSYHQNLQ